jgi:hypothetical protein
MHQITRRHILDNGDLNVTKLEKSEGEFFEGDHSK